MRYHRDMEKTTTRKPVPMLPTSDLCWASEAAPTLAPARAAALADRLKALADATRLRMLNLLAQQAEPLCVCDITRQFDQQQPTISHHLRVLREAGLVECEKRGIWAYYWATASGRHWLERVEAGPTP